MKNTNYKKIVTILSLGGFLFSGYLSAVKLITSTCALREPCPYFLGYPACWFGFGLFTILFGSSLLSWLTKISLRNIAGVQAITSVLGILFSGYFTIPEVSRIMSGTGTYALGLPTCAYGFIFYLCIGILSVRYLMRK